MTIFYDKKPWEKTYPNWLSIKFPKNYETVLDKFERAVVNYPQDTCIFYFDRSISFPFTI